MPRDLWRNILSRPSSGSVRFSTRSVSFTPGSGPSWWGRRSSAVNPKPKSVTLCVKLVKIGAKVVRHGRSVTFQLAEVAVPKELFQKILGLIDDLQRRPVPA